MNQAKENFIRLIESQSSINDRYSNIKRLTKNAGDGRFSLVFTAFDSTSKQNVALKFFDPECASNMYRVECFERETKILKKLKGARNILEIIEGKNTLTLNASFEDLIIPFQFQFYSAELAKSDLRKYIYLSNTNPIQNIIFFREMCKSTQRIHANNICHRDLKPSNFLIFNQKEIKLSDFGTARTFNEETKPLWQKYPGPVGDITYTSPELLCGIYFEEELAFWNDFYSLGAILFEMFTRTNFNISIFNNIQKIQELIQYFQVTTESRRKKIFDGFIKGIAQDNPLPDIFAYNTEVPNCIKHIINDLYKSLANLDYRKRLTDFNRIFMRIDICRIILENEQKYKKWKEIKKKKKEKKVLEKYNDRPNNR